MFAEITFQQGLAWAVLLMVAGYFYFRSARPAPPPERVPFSKLKEEQELQKALQPPPEMVRWQVEMHETARDLKAELDSKIATLNVLIRDARIEQQRLADWIARAEATRSES